MTPDAPVHPLGDPEQQRLWRNRMEHDPTWNRVCRWLSAVLEFRHTSGSTFVDIHDGAVAGITALPPPRGARLVLEAADQSWNELIRGERTLYGALAARDVELRGDLVFAMHNLRGIDATVRALQGALGEPQAPQPSPDPTYPAARTTGRYVDVNGIRTYYEEAGDGPPLLCVHAAAQDTLMFRHQMDGLSHAFRVIAFDAPGHGKTLEPASGPYDSTTQHAEFTEHFIDALVLRAPVLLGCSMAGNMVLELAARRPDSYRAVVSAEGAAHTPTLDQFTLDMIEVNGNTLTEVFARSLTGRRTPSDRAREAVWQLSRSVPEVMRADLTAYANFDKRQEITEISCPVLLLRGDDDWLVSQAMVEATAAAIPRSRIALLSGTGHYPMIENPVEFNEAVAAFLQHL